MSSIPPIPPECAKIIGEIPQHLQKLWNVVKPFIDKVASFYNRTLPVLSYRRLIDDMVTFKPDDGRIKAAAAVKESKPNGDVKVNVVYLDADNNPIWDDGKSNDYSFAIAAQKLDEELEKTFNGKNIIIFN